MAGGCDREPHRPVWSPLRIAAVRALWRAQLGSVIGTWMQTVGAQWLLVDDPNASPSWRSCRPRACCRAPACWIWPACARHLEVHDGAHALLDGPDGP